MCFVWISEQTAIITLYSINLLVFIREIQPLQYALYTDNTQTGLDYHAATITNDFNNSVN
jgi:hypothetical protein